MGGSKVKPYHYCCGGHVMKGSSVCETLLLKKDPLEDVLLDAIRKRIDALVTGEGEVLLRRAIEEEINDQGKDPRKQAAELRAGIREIDGKAGMLLDTITPEARDFIQTKLGELMNEERRLTAKVEELDATPYRTIDTDEALHHGLADLERLPHPLETAASLEVRKQFIRMFVTGVTVEPDEKRLTIEIRRIPAARDLAKPGMSSVDVVTGARFEPLQMRIELGRGLLSPGSWREAA